VIKTRKIEQTKTVKLPFEGEVADRSAVVAICVFGEESVFDLVVVPVCVFGEESVFDLVVVPVCVFGEESVFDLVVVPVCVFGEESVFDLVVVAVCVFGEETTLPINRVPTGGTNGDGGEGDACFLGIHEQSDSKQTE